MGFPPTSVGGAVARFLACLALLCFSLPAFGYTGYRLFTINHTLTGTADSTNFTVLVSGTFAEFATTANGGKVQNTVSCGVNSITCPADLVFTSDSGCSSPLSGWEFESYTAATGLIIAWVRVPTLSVTTDTLIYACVGDSSVNTFQGGPAGSAFDSNTRVVYHFGNGTTLSTQDSSSGGYNATPVNSPTAVTGEIGGAAHFNGVNQYVESASFPWTGTSAVTVSFWNFVATAQVSFAFTVGNSGATDPQRFSVAAPWNPANIFWDYGGQTINLGRVQTNYTSYLNTWTYVTLVSTGFANTLQAIYLNSSLASSSASSLSSTVTGDLIVGAYPWASVQGYGPPYHNGSIDEFRISNVVRSASWIKAEYNNQSSPATFATASPFALLGVGPFQQVVCDYTVNAPCTVNASTITIPLRATTSGSALIMTYGGGATSTNTIASVSCPGCSWVEAITCSQSRVVSVYYALNVPAGTTALTVILNNVAGWWFNVSEWSWLQSAGTAGTVIDKTGCSGGASSATQTSASVTTTNPNDLIIFADRVSSVYSSGATNGFVNMSESAIQPLFSAYFLSGATGTYSSSFTTSSAAAYVTAIVAFFPRPLQRSHIFFIQ